MKIDAKEMLFKIKPTLDLLDQLKEKDALIENLKKGDAKGTAKKYMESLEEEITRLREQFSQKDAELNRLGEGLKLWEYTSGEQLVKIQHQNEQISTLKKELAELEAAHNSCLKESNEVYKEQIAKLLSALEIEKEWSKTIAQELESKKEKCVAYEALLRAKEQEFERDKRCGAHSGDNNEKRFCQYCLVDEYR